MVHLGISPFITANITAAMARGIPYDKLGLVAWKQALSQFRPLADTFALDDDPTEYNQERFKKSMVWLGTVIGICQAMALTVTDLLNFASWAPVQRGHLGPTLFFLGGVTTVLVLGSIVTQRVAKLIDDHGLGDGMTFVITVGIASDLVVQCRLIGQAVLTSPTATATLNHAVIASLGVMAAFGVIFLLAVWTVKFPLRSFIIGRQTDTLANYSSSTAVSDVGGQRSTPAYLPIKPCPSPTLVLFFSSIIQMSLPQMAVMMGRMNPLGGGDKLATAAALHADALTWINSVWGDALTFVLVIALQALFLGKLERVSEHLQQSNMLVVDEETRTVVHPGPETTRYLEKHVRKYRALSGVVLACLVLASKYFDKWCQSVFEVKIGVVSFVLVAALLLSVVREVHALNVRHRARKYVEGTFAPLMMRGDVYKLP